MLSKTIMPRRVRGFTLTEAAIVLGIVGLILGAIWVAAASVYTNLRVSNTTTQILQAAQGIRTLYANRGGLDSTATAIPTILLRDSGAVPKDIIGGTTAAPTLISQWGGVITISSGATANDFFISYANTPKDTCMGLVSSITGASRDAGLVSITAGAVTQTDFSATTPTWANTNCVTGGGVFRADFRLKG